MRPRVFPAEDGAESTTSTRPPGSFNEAAGIPRGRHVLVGRSYHFPFCASMRPRVFPAEDLEDLTPFTVRRLASMRPRVFPAEDDAIELDRAEQPELQ